MPNAIKPPKEVQVVYDSEGAIVAVVDSDGKDLGLTRLVRFEENTSNLSLRGDIEVDGVVSVGNIISTAAAPVAANSTGTAGEIRSATGFLYICTATNTWQRVATATWP